MAFWLNRHDWLTFFFFFSSRRRHTRCSRDWSSDVCSSDLNAGQLVGTVMIARVWRVAGFELAGSPLVRRAVQIAAIAIALVAAGWLGVTSAREVAHGQ